MISSRPEEDLVPDACPLRRGPLVDGPGQARRRPLLGAPADLLAALPTVLIDRTGIDPGTRDDVMVGCVGDADEQSATPGRQAWLAAGYPVHVPSMTIERKCSSGQQALKFAQSILPSANDIVIAAGMSRWPGAHGLGPTGADPYGTGVTNRFPDMVPQGVSAELVADKWGVSRAQLDEYSARSHGRAAAVAADGGFGRRAEHRQLAEASAASAGRTRGRGAHRAGPLA